MWKTTFLFYTRARVRCLKFPLRAYNKKMSRCTPKSSPKMRKKGRQRKKSETIPKYGAGCVAACRAVSKREGARGGAKSEKISKKRGINLFLGKKIKFFMANTTKNKKIMQNFLTKYAAHVIISPIRAELSHFLEFGCVLHQVHFYIFWREK